MVMAHDTVATNHQKKKGGGGLYIDRTVMAENMQARKLWVDEMEQGGPFFVHNLFFLLLLLPTGARLG